GRGSCTNHPYRVRRGHPVLPMMLLDGGGTTRRGTPMAGDSAQRGSGQAPAGTSETPAGSRTAGPSLPWWVPPVGRSAWLLVGIAILVAIVLLVLGLISDLLIPLTFAAILGAVFVPLVDRFERWHIH